jgi:hypothetical protein
MKSPLHGLNQSNVIAILASDTIEYKVRIPAREMAGHKPSGQNLPQARKRK